MSAAQRRVSKPVTHEFGTGQVLLNEGNGKRAKILGQRTLIRRRKSKATRIAAYVMTVEHSAPSVVTEERILEGDWLALSPEELSELND